VSQAEIGSCADIVGAAAARAPSRAVALAARLAVVDVVVKRSAALSGKNVAPSAFSCVAKAERRPVAADVDVEDELVP
jgi:hypothetical protein